MNHLGCWPHKCATTMPQIDSMGQIRLMYAKNHNSHNINYLENNNGYNVQVVHLKPVLVRLTWLYSVLCVTIVCFRRLLVGLWLGSYWMIVVICSKFRPLRSDASVGLPCSKSRHAIGHNPPTPLETPYCVPAAESPK